MERKFDNKYELMRNEEENGDDKHRVGTLALTKKKLPPTCMHGAFCAPQKPIKVKRGNANIKNHQNLNKAIALGHSERKCCSKRLEALIVSAMVVAAPAGLVGSDDRFHALVALGGSKLSAESLRFARRLCLAPLGQLSAESFALRARLSIFRAFSLMSTANDFWREREGGNFWSRWLSFARHHI
jgi:hypothetical protein